MRNWYARLPEITRNADELQGNAEEAARALLEGARALPGLGVGGGGVHNSSRRTEKNPSIPCVTITRQY